MSNDATHLLTEIKNGEEVTLRPSDDDTHENTVKYEWHYDHDAGEGVLPLSFDIVDSESGEVKQTKWTTIDEIRRQLEWCDVVSE